MIPSTYFSYLPNNATILVDWGNIINMRSFTV